MSPFPVPVLSPPSPGLGKIFHPLLWVLDWGHKLIASSGKKQTPTLWKRQFSLTKSKPLTSTVRSSAILVSSSFSTHHNHVLYLFPPLFINFYTLLLSFSCIGSKRVRSLALLGTRCQCQRQWHRVELHNTWFTVGSTCC